MVKRVTGSESTNSSGSGIPEAPINGNSFVRKDAAWVKLRNESIATFSLDRSLPELSRTLSLTGTTNPLLSVNMVLIDIAKLGGSILIGDSLEPNTVNGSLNVIEDVTSIQTSGFLRARFQANDVVVIGIGIGDSTDLPDLAGETSSSGTLVSRFVDAARGDGNQREVTFQLPYFPVGRTSSLAAEVGDEIFLVAWTEETDDASVVFDDIIFTARAFN